MCARFREKTALDRRLKEVRRELDELHGDLRAVARGKPPRRAADEGYQLPPTPPAAEAREPAWRKVARSFLPQREESQPELFPSESTLRPRDERFVDYLSSRFSSEPALRHERQIQRNKAIAMTVLVVLMLLWLIHRYLL